MQLGLERWLRQLKALAALAQEPAWLPASTWQPGSACNYRSGEPNALFRPLRALACIWYIYTHSGTKHTQKNDQFLIHLLISML